MCDLVSKVRFGKSDNRHQDNEIQSMLYSSFHPNVHNYDITSGIHRIFKRKVEV